MPPVGGQLVVVVAVDPEQQVVHQQVAADVLAPVLVLVALRLVGRLGDRQPVGRLVERQPAGQLGDRQPAGPLAERQPAGLLAAVDVIIVAAAEQALLAAAVGP